MIVVRVLNPSRNRLGDAAPAVAVPVAFDVVSPTAGAAGPASGRAEVSSAELDHGAAHVDDRTDSRGHPRVSVRHGRPTIHLRRRAA